MQHSAIYAVLFLVWTIGGLPSKAQPVAGKPEVVEKIEAIALPGTQLLTMQGDIASNLVAGVDRFLLRKTDEAIGRRAQFWNRDLSSHESYVLSVATNRQRLAHILGVRDARPKVPEFTFLAADTGSVWVTEGDGYDVFRVRWRAVDNVFGEGLLLAPRDGFGRIFGRGDRNVRPVLQSAQWVVAIPDADHSPEQIVGLEGDLPPAAQYARRLAEAGAVVLVPTLVNRRTGESKAAEGNRGAGLSNREFLYRPAFELGRHLIGYELQKVFAAIDWFETVRNPNSRMGVMGWGEGGLLALHAGALDTRIHAVCVSGYFDNRQGLWQEPIERNVFGLLERFGDAEVASLIVPRSLLVEAAMGPEIVVPPGTGGGPGRLTTPGVDAVRAEVLRARQLVSGLQPPARIQFVASGNGNGLFGTDQALNTFIAELAPNVSVGQAKRAPSATGDPDLLRRHRQQMREINDHTQKLLTESSYVRQKFMAGLDTSSVEKYLASAEPYRDFFYREVIGRFDDPVLPPNVRTRKVYEAEKWTGYEVVMDVYKEVMAFGILLLPKDLQEGERRPVVVCQHGLEGRPRDVVMGDVSAYHDYAARLAERGFITFAPQNLYIFTDRFRTLQRKANPLGKTLFSIIVPQHQQIVDWLKTQPFVDNQRIAFYGLSYGGKTAMRVPPLVKDYCLSICSADFNEWVWKNASTRSPYSYVWTGEYEIFEFDLGSTFNYAEMAALIAPRPFMVERGHFDGVAPDETVFYEYGKVRFLYAARLGLGDRCELETFVGPHTIHGVGTFDFLHKHLNWPRRP